ncbi:MAG: response regulator [Chloroflexota bacterium]
MRSFHGKLVSLARWRATFLAGLVLMYIGVFFPMYFRSGGDVLALSIVPVAAIGWLLGMRGGVAAGILSFLLNTLLLNLAGEPGWDVLIRLGGGPGSLSLVLIGVISGYMGDLRTRLQQELRERRYTEAALTEMVERFHLVTQATRDAIYDLKLSANRSWRNENYRRLFGGEEEVDDDLNWWSQRIHPDDRERVSAALQTAFGSGQEVWVAEYRFQRATGDYAHIEDHGYIMRNAAGVPIRLIGAMTDLSERVRAEEVLRQAQKLDSLGIMAGGIAHDFNNLLVGMLGQTSLALAKMPPGSPAATHLEKAVKATERAADLIRQLLAYSGRGQLEVGPVHLNTLIQESLPLLELAVPKHISIGTTLAHSLPVIEADTTQLQQVLMNLILNAVQAIGDNQGVVSIVTGRQEVQTEDEHLWRQYTIRPLTPGYYVTVEVSDNGQGMDTKTLTRIFDPFFTTKPNGRGLGLSAVLGIVRGHKGGLEVRSQPGRGTIFRLLFPAHQSAFVPPPPSPNSQGQALMPGLILVIDDEPLVREAITDVLELDGLEVITAADGASGLTLYREQQNEIDLVLLDLSMPGMNGQQTFEELCKVNPAVQVIVSSGYAKEEASRHFVKPGPAAFCQKPYRAEELTALVRQCLARKVTVPVK